MALLEREGKFSCGGTLVAPRWVLTAAHCTLRKETEANPNAPLDAARLKVVLGRSVRSKPGGTTFSISRVVRHAQYEHKPGHHAYDVALLRLARPASARVIALPPSNDRSLWQAGRMAFALGWGHTSATAPPSDELKRAAVPLVSDDECGDAYRWHLRIKIDFAVELCAGFTTTPRDDICAGDSGGPLSIARGRRGPALIGVVSGGMDPCGETSQPSGYARVGEGGLRAWLEGRLHPPRQLPTYFYHSRQGYLVRPTRLDFCSSGCEYEQLRWSGWNSPVTVGSGYHAPSVGGRIEGHYPVTLTLSEPRRCPNGRRIYTRFVQVYSGERSAYTTPRHESRWRCNGETATPF